MSGPNVQISVPTQNRITYGSTRLAAYTRLLILLAMMVFLNLYVFGLMAVILFYAEISIAAAILVEITLAIRIGISIHLVEQINTVTFGVESVDSAEALFEKMESAVDGACYLSTWISPGSAIETTSQLGTSICQVILENLASEVTREFNRIRISD